MMVVKDSAYWLSEINKTEDELSAIINGDLSTVKTAKTDEDTITQYDIDMIMKVKMNYITYCKNKYQEELAKEKPVNAKKPILFFDREFGY